MTVAYLGYEINSSQAVSAGTNLDKMTAATQRAEAASARLATMSASSNAALLRIAAGVDLANVALAKLVAATDASSASSTKFVAGAKQMEAANTSGARASEGAAIALRSEAAATDAVTAAIARQNAAAVTQASLARARTAAGVDVWGRTSAERPALTTLAAPVVALPAPKTFAPGVPAVAPTAAVALLRESAIATAALGTAFGLVSGGLMSLIPMAIEWGLSILDTSKKTEETLEKHKKLIDDISVAYPKAAEAAKMFELAATKMPQNVAFADASQQFEMESKRYQSAMANLAGAMEMGIRFSGLSGKTFSPLVDGIREGRLEANDLNKALADVRIDPNAGSQAKSFAEGLKEAVDQALKLQGALEGSNAAAMSLNASRASVGGPGAFDRAQAAGMDALSRRIRQGDDPFGGIRIDPVQESITAARRREVFDAQMQGIGARSPDERANAARASASAQYNKGETDEARQFRIQAAGALALAQAQHTLDEAQKQRGRSLDQTLARQQVDLDVIGKTTGAAEALRMQFQLTQQVRDEAARNNVAVDQNELDLIKQKTAAYGVMADQIARAKLGDDLAFERSQLFLNPNDQAIASRLRGTGLGMDSPEAQAMRQNQEFADNKAIIKGFFSDVQTHAIKSGDDIGKALGNAALNSLSKLSQKLWDNAFDSIATSIASAFTGTKAGGGAGAGAIIGSVVASLTGANDNSGGAPVIPVTRAPLGAVSDIAAARREALSMIESGGNYGAIGPTDPDLGRALGKYQVMEANVGPWSKETFGRSVSADEFLSSKRIQDAIVDKKMAEYTELFGDRGAGQAWFGGPGSVGKDSRTDVLGTSVGSYGNQYVNNLAKTSTALDGVTTSATVASQNLGGFAGGLGKLGGALNQAPAALGGASSSGGFFSFLGNLFGGGGGAASSVASIVSPRMFAKGGIANEPSIFGDGDMAEAAVPLPDGRSIPVNMRVTGGRGTNSGGAQSGPLSVSVEGEVVTRFEDDGTFHTYMDKMTVKAAQAGQALAVRQVASNFKSYQVQTNKFGRVDQL